MREDRGKFITFEGIEGCGKSTQSALLSDFLESHGVPYIHTKEPGDTLVGAEIRKILLSPKHAGMDPTCEAFLYLADRAQHVNQVVRPALAEGTWVICDRYHDSTTAYQGAARGLCKNDLGRLFQMATGGLQPDLTILLDLPADIGLARARHRNKRENLEATESRFEEEALAFHQEVRREFLAMAEREPARFRRLDANREIDVIQTDIRAVVVRQWEFAGV